MILNDGDIYETLLSRGRISTPVSGTETMTVDNGVVSAHSAPGSTRKPSTIFYDREQGKFCYGYNQTFYACGSVGSSPFDPGNAPRPAMHRGRHQHRQRHPHPADAESRRQPCALHLRQLLRFGRRTRRQADLRNPGGGQRPHRRSP